MTLSELIEALEKATGPDRALDCAIFVATAPSPFVSYYPDCVLATLGGFAARVEIADIPAYTASLDAALTLVPEGWTVARIGQNDNKTWHVELRHGHCTSFDRVVIAPRDCAAATPALALTLACMKARKP